MKMRRLVKINYAEDGSDIIRSSATDREIKIAIKRALADNDENFSFYESLDIELSKFDKNWQHVYIKSTFDVLDNCKVVIK